MMGEGCSMDWVLFSRTYFFPDCVRIGDSLWLASLLDMISQIKLIQWKSLEFISLGCSQYNNCNWNVTTHNQNHD